MLLSCARPRWSRHHLGCKLTAVDVHDSVEIERAIATFASQPDGGLIVVPHPYTIANRGSIIILAARHRLPAVYPLPIFRSRGRPDLLRARSDRSMARGRRPMSIASSRARSRPTCRCRRRPSRAGDQPQDRQGARPRRPAVAARPRRRGDRMKTARVHHAARRRGGGVAARGARAAARADAAHRRAPARGRGRSGFQARVAAFLQALAQLGWTIGRNVRIDIRWATANAADIRRHAAELVALAPDVILAHGGCDRGAVAAGDPHRADRVRVVTDPVGAGFVDSLARPGGNATGFMTVRIQPEREMAGAAQGDRAGRDASGGPSGSRHTRRDSASSPPSRPWRRRSGWRSARSTCATPARSSAPSRHSRALRMAA